MANQKIYFWGIEVLEKMDKKKIQLFFPICVEFSTGRRFAVRGNIWSLCPERNIAWFDGGKKPPIPNVELDLPGQILIAPGQLAVLMGPKVWRYLSDIASSGMIEGISREWVSMPDGFKLKLMSFEEYDGFQSDVAKLAISIFDREIHIGQGKDLSKKAQSALEIINLSPNVSLRDKAVRIIVGMGFVALNKQLLTFSQIIGESTLALRDEAARYMRETISNSQEKGGQKD